MIFFIYKRALYRLDALCLHFTNFLPTVKRQSLGFSYYCHHRFFEIGSNPYSSYTDLYIFFDVFRRSKPTIIIFFIPTTTGFRSFFVKIKSLTYKKIDLTTVIFRHVRNAFLNGPRAPVYYIHGNYSICRCSILVETTIQSWLFTPSRIYVFELRQTAVVDVYETHKNRLENCIKSTTVPFTNAVNRTSDCELIEAMQTYRQRENLFVFSSNRSQDSLKKKKKKNNTNTGGSMYAV